MAQRHDYWTHGVATILEFPERATFVAHNGFGTTVEQNANTSAWFHIPISTPSYLAGDSTTYLYFLTLAAKVNASAKVDLIHVRRGKDLLFEEAVSFVDRNINHSINTPDPSTSMGASSGSGVTLCVRVQFLPGVTKGRVEFYGAGAAFA